MPTQWRALSTLSNNKHDDNPRLSWALSLSTIEIEQDCPGFLTTIERMAQQASSLRGACSSSRGVSSSNVIYLDEDNDDAANVN